MQSGVGAHGCQLCDQPFLCLRDDRGLLLGCCCCLMSLPLPSGICCAVCLRGQVPWLLDLVQGIAFGWGNPDVVVSLARNLTVSRVNGRAGSGAGCVG